jgi:exonuclease III
LTQHPGIRAWCKKNGHDFLAKEDPDIFAMMEVKCSEDKLPSEIKDYPGYHKYWLAGSEDAKEGYAGVGYGFS